MGFGDIVERGFVDCGMAALAAEMFRRAALFFAGGAGLTGKGRSASPCRWTMFAVRSGFGFASGGANGNNKEDKMKKWRRPA